MKVLISGATGLMGQRVRQVVQERDHEVVAGVTSHASDEADFPIVADFSDVPHPESIDVIIDFSTPDVLDGLLRFATDNQVPTVIATTGYSDTQLEQIEATGKTIPILRSSNMSYGVNVMERIVTELAQLLSDYDIEIVEKHHRHKKDAPSGTAEMLFDAVNRGRNGQLTVETDRYHEKKTRSNETVGISSLRGGEIVGEHTVVFAGDDDTIEITHRAASKRLFAAGAVKAAEWLVSQETGYYTMVEMMRGNSND